MTTIQYIGWAMLLLIVFALLVSFFSCVALSTESTSTDEPGQTPTKPRLVPEKGVTRLVFGTTVLEVPNTYTTEYLMGGGAYPVLHTELEFLTNHVRVGNRYFSTLDRDFNTVSDYVEDMDSYVYDHLEIYWDMSLFNRIESRDN